MPRPIKFKLVIKILENQGFFFVSQIGSHAKFRKLGDPTLNVIVPIYEKEIRHGTFKSILRQSQLKENDFIKK
ncbi:type II toxin-antitoxin system HicA family toxin [Patescibacteria group bacterium]|nr:type II toxin-antitoxin system HicA family toxin [Patescibacteria group bacterium]MBU1421067.1 type II toxin-antitoxin system HicA family toxin [Patescibacteria group bacterium]MBU2415955.1 type II toxin-antitoxin system HicA family toxin [Patescibacteria group bacterium]